MNVILAINWLDPEYLLHLGGIALLLIIVFLESGILFGFFFPGDSVLISAGVLVQSGFFKIDLWALIVLIICAGLLGTLAGYYTGYKIRTLNIHYLNRKFFKEEYIEQSRKLYNKYDFMAFIFGRFIPIVRTFLPIFSGMIKVPLKRFFLINVIGFAIWTVLMTTAGYFLSSLSPFLTEHFELTLLIYNILTLLPVFIVVIRKSWKMKTRHSREQAEIKTL